MGAGCVEGVAQGMVKGFDEAEYTRDREIKTLLAIQAHASDGSALEGCTCLQGKHFYELEGNSEEGALIATRENEKEFYAKMAPFARAARKAIIDGTFEFPKSVVCGSYTLHDVDVQRDLKHEVAVTEIHADEGTATIHINPKLQAHPKLEKTVINHEIHETKCAFKCLTDCHKSAAKAEPRGDRKQILALVHYQGHSVGECAAACHA